MPAASVRAVAGALSFLTIMPVGRIAALDGRDVLRGTLLFPLVGAGMGALTGGIALGLHSWLPAFTAAGVAVAAAGTGTVPPGVPRLFAVATVLLGLAIALIAVKGDAVWLAVSAALVAIGLGLVYRRWLGGATGDCLGAVTELCETVLLVVAAGLS